MDDRLRELKEGAGREDSRINDEFIDFLSKWSTPVLVVLAVLALGYWGLNQFKSIRVDKVNQATSEYTSATTSSNPNPDTLSKIASKYAGVRSFGYLAKLDLADIYLFAVQRGLAPGAEYDPTTELPKDEILDDQGRKKYLDLASGLYREVYDATKSVPGKAQLAIEGAFGLAAVAESAGDMDKAREYLGDAKKLAEKAGFAGLALAADARMESLGKQESLTLFEKSKLPPLPEPEPKIDEPSVEEELAPGATGEGVVGAETGEPQVEGSEPGAADQPDQPAENETPKQNGDDSGGGG